MAIKAASVRKKRLKAIQKKSNKAEEAIALSNKEGNNNKGTKHLKGLSVVEHLQRTQEEYGFLPEKKMRALAKRYNIPAIDIFGVATFYSQFKLKKPGKYEIAVCTGTACHIKRSPVLVRYVEELLGIKPGETTKDGKFSFKTVNCIGACARAPAMMINDRVYGELTKQKVKEIFSALK